MHHLRLFAPVAALMVGLLVFGSAWQVSAQDSAPSPHPAVGGWHVTSDPTDPLLSLLTTVLMADGTLVNITGGDTSPTVGVWAPTSETTADLTIIATTDGPAYVLIRASIEVAPDGQSFTGTYTNQFVFDPAGEGMSGQVGPGTLTAERLTVEGPGTPEASFADIFPQPDVAPEATPVS